MLPLNRQGVFGDGSDGKVYSTAWYTQRPKHCSLVINKVQETTPHHHFHLYASSQDQFQNPSFTYISYLTHYSTIRPLRSPHSGMLAVTNVKKNKKAEDRTFSVRLWNSLPEAIRLRLFMLLRGSSRYTFIPPAGINCIKLLFTLSDSLSLIFRLFRLFYL